MNITVKCMLCRTKMRAVTNTHLKKHKINFQEYKKRFPNSKITSTKTKEKRSNSMIGKLHTKETKRKLSEIHKGKVIKEETKKKISEKLKGKKLKKEQIQKLKEYYKIHENPFKGKKHTKEARRKIGEAGKGRRAWNKSKICPEETKRKISEKLKGRKISLETRKKMGLAQKGKVVSENTRRKISKSKKGIKMSLEHKNNMLKAINKSPNKFEEKYIKLFKKNNLPLRFVGDFKSKNFFIAGKVPDFVSTNRKKVIVEIFCDYFKIKQYGCVKNYKKDRKEIFSKSGWKTLFFSHEEIESDFEKCIKIMKKELE